MITFVLYGLSVITGTPVPGSVYWLTGLVDGLIFMPLLSLAIVPIAGRISREKIGRLHYLQAVYPLKAVALVLTPSGYEFAPVVNDEARLSNGQRIELGENRTWYRLGNRKFAVTYEPDPDVLRDIHVKPDSVKLDTVIGQDDSGHERQYPAVFDKGGVLDKVRGPGFHGWTPFISREHDGDGYKIDADGYLVSLSRAINGLRGGGGVRLSERVERMTRVKHGGKNTLSGRGKMYAYLGVILSGSVIFTLIFGVL